ncbi:ParB/RepB/Spo0J family partition protein [Candidatus Igneacidithiobacillus taiwanensis]|uniref:ParB/RepB/Spo0J family partition protein n=1 Tax=Candidatus Igneacidithiobacillus taiwanensis TaxID=1945924 RepID=UPI00289B02DC|nr:ParB/RepB/Spo0J family partition protein [Candidatus Igneacidithiobacillus taiwanensis]
MAKIDRSKGLYDELQAALHDLNEEECSPKEREDKGELPAGAGDTVQQQSGAVLFLALSDIEPDPDQPRKSFVGDEQDVNTLEALRDSILQHGVLQPIAVRRMDSGRYRIIAGERRWRASCAAQASGEPCRRTAYDLSRIPVVIMEPENDADRLEMQLVENLARADMPAIDTARALERLRSCMVPKPSMEELAKRLGRSKAWVHQMLSLVSPESEAVADALGVPVESIGRTDLSRMCGWNKDEEKRVVISAIRARLDAGEPLTRALVDEEEERYEQFRRQAPGGGQTPGGELTPNEGQNIDRAQPTNAAGENTMEQTDEYIVVSGPEDLKGLDLDDGTYGEADEDEDVMGAGSLSDSPAGSLGGGGSESGAAAGSQDGSGQGGTTPEGGEMPALTSVTFAVPMEMVERMFAMLGKPLEGNPKPGQIIDVISEILDSVNPEALGARNG